MLLADTGPDWIQVAQNFGVPVMCMVALSYAMWRIGKWIGIYILKPLSDRHLIFIDQVAGSLTAATTNITSLTQSLEAVADKMREIADGRKDELAKFDHILNKLTELHASVVEVRQVVLKTDSVVITPTAQKGRGNAADPGRQS